MTASLWTVVLVAVGGGAGAVLRYLADKAMKSRTNSEWPLSTVVINVTGSLLLGTLLGAALRWPSVVGSEVVLLCGAGILGGYTTFSTASWDTVQLASTKGWPHAGAYAVVSVILSITAASIGVLAFA